VSVNHDKRGLMMSVAFLSADELGRFAGIAVKVEKIPLPTMCQLLEIASRSNASAYLAQYGEKCEPVTADDIEREALSALTTPGALVIPFGAVCYNLCTNGGTVYIGEQPVDPKANALFATLNELETRCRKWRESEERRIKRQREDDAAYAKVGPLPKLSREELLAMRDAAGCERVIIAEYHVDESELQSDYWGGRTVREVVIGFGKGKRESFKQLREAASKFEPTRHLGPGRDQWRVRVYHEKADEKYRNATAEGPTFETEADAQAWIDAEMAVEGNEASQAGMCARSCGYRLSRESVEHRENYSMGGGNYLGCSRHGGWKVISRETPYAEATEFFEAPATSPAAAPAKQTTRKHETNQPVEPMAAPIATPKQLHELTRKEYHDLRRQSEGYDVCQCNKDYWQLINAALAVGQTVANHTLFEFRQIFGSSPTE